MDLTAILNDYDLSNLTIGVLGGHSALDVCHGAKKYGFKTLAVCQKGREKTYNQYYKTRNGRGCIDEVILVDNFAGITKPEIQEQLRKLNTIFVHNRYFWVYCDFAAIENDFKVPIFGSRDFVKLEERDHENNQYVLLKKAGIRTPRIIREGGENITTTELAQRLDDHFVIQKGGPLIVKANEAIRTYERAFFVITSERDYHEISDTMIATGKLTAEGVANAVIEEFILGAQVNFNYFYSPLTGDLELMGTDLRRQTSLDGFLRLDAQTQMQLLQKGYKPSLIETGHIACTVKESILEKAFTIGEQFIATMQQEFPPGIVGPFALQGAVDSQHGKEEIVIFDVSMRIPGSPGTKFTPYSGYLYGESMSFGERIGLELKLADGNKDKLVKLLS